MFLDQAMEMQMQEMEMFEDNGGGGGGGSSGSSTTVVLDLPVRLRTKWSQGAPYNKFAPNGVAGCVMIAAAQALGHFQTVGSVQWQHNNSYGSSIINWSQIITNSEENLGGYGRLHETSQNHLQSAIQVSHLTRFLGVVLDADYKSDGKTGGDTGDAVKYLKNWCSLSSSTSLKDYNVLAFSNALIQNPNCLIMARSHANRTNRFLGLIYTYKDGHAWIIDGVRRIRYNSSGAITDYVHCNWGWGGRCDGYFVSGSFNTQVRPNFLGPNDQSTTPSEYNFRYNKEYAILAR